MEVKPGYKRTEVGVIPEEWEVAKLSRICSMKSGEGITSLNIDQFSRYPCYGGNGLRGFTSRFTHNGRYALIGRQGALCGNVLGVEGTFFASEHAVVVTALARIEIRWLTFVLGDMRLNQYSESSAQPGLSVSKILNLSLALPPLPEQCAIATALGDVDVLLGALTRLIAKKRDLKQAAMQQLLTGQTRLPGFSGEWEIKQLGDLGVTYGGLTGKTKSDFGAGCARYITFLNILNNVVIDPEKFEPVRVQSLERQNQVLKGDLFFNGSSETPEEVGMCSVLLAEVRNVFLNSFCFGFRLHDGAKDNRVFLAYFFRSNEGRELLYSLAQGATRYNLSKTSLLKLTFPLPEPDEQSAIAAVLSDMDAEIEVIEARLAKIRSLKQGMMQELLTGRIRLV